MNTRKTMEFDYPLNCNKKKHRERTMRRNPDTLYRDEIFQKGKEITIDLLYYSTKKIEWKSTICDTYTNFVKETIDHGERFIICYDTMLDIKHPLLTISCYTTGTFLVQGNDENLKSFEENFSQMKTVATNMNNQDPADSPPQPSTSDQPKDERAKEKDTAKTVAEETSSSVNDLADDFSAMPVK